MLRSLRAPDGRFGRRKFILGAIGLWVCGIALTLAPSVAVIMIGLGLCAGCGLLCQTVSTGYVTTTAREGRSSAVGLYVIANLLCNILMNSVFLSQPSNRYRYLG